MLTPPSLESAYSPLLLQQHSEGELAESHDLHNSRSRGRVLVDR